MGFPAHRPYNTRDRICEPGISRCARTPVNPKRRRDVIHTCLGQELTPLSSKVRPQPNHQPRTCETQMRGRANFDLPKVRLGAPA